MLNISTKPKIIFLIILGVLVYLPTFSNPFIWDDENIIVKNPYLRGFTPVREIFQRDLLYGTLPGSNFYRPLQTLSYRIDYFLWGTNPSGYHISNFLLHLLASFLIFIILTRISLRHYFRTTIISRGCAKDLKKYRNSPKRHCEPHFDFAQRKLRGEAISKKTPPDFLPFLASVFFLIHPVHTEAVAYISGRADLLAATFIFLSLFFYLKKSDLGGHSGPELNLPKSHSETDSSLSKSHSEPKRSPSKSHSEPERSGGEESLIYLFLSLLCYTLALLSKEISLVFPFALFLIPAIRGRKQKLFGKASILPFFILSIVYVVLRLGLLDFSRGTVFSSADPLIGRLLTFSKTLPVYLGLLLFPVNLHMERILSPAQDLADAGVIASLGLVAMIFFFLLLYFRRRSPFLFGCGIWFFLWLIPVSNLVPLNAPLAEHWLYLPSIGIIAGIVFAFSGVSRKKIVSAAIVTFICFSILTWKRNEEWGHPQTFYEENSRKSPRSSMLALALGNIYMEKNLDERAEEEFLRAIRLKPDFPEAHNNLAIIYKGRNELARALAEIKKALRYNPRYHEALNNMGRIYEKMGKLEEAGEAYREAIRLNPFLPEAHNNLGIVWYRLENFTEAEKEFREALRLRPFYPEAFYNLGNLYLGGGDADRAILNFQEALRIKPDYLPARVNLGSSWAQSGDYDSARQEWEEALNLDPDCRPARENLEKLERLGY